MKKSCEPLPMQLLLPGINSTIKNQINKKQISPDLDRRTSGESPI